ncbi:low molecular weight phosphatase family protein [Aquimarina sp. W85]|uniref:arsenate-mycothiol transferase ArsC n=1 Tax=Aquimarina rhodophyticola TaxID=3342246 RepID=UPI00366E59DB
MYTPIKQTIEHLNPETITKERAAVLQPLVAFIQHKIETHQQIRINFICTHNSRRSHLSQIWAQTMASYFGINHVYCYSSGTEVTALFPSVIDALQHAGFKIHTLANTENPVYSIKYDDNEPAIIGFSKKIDDTFNPTSQFAAIMTCDSANEACPFVPGAEKRIPITFEDPKVFDNTPDQQDKYQERSLQIATDLWYVFSQLKA